MPMSAKFVELFLLASLMNAPDSEDQNKNPSDRRACFLTPEGVGDRAVISALEVLGVLQKNDSRQEEQRVLLRLPGWDESNEGELLGYSLPSIVRQKYKSVQLVKADLKDMSREDKESGLQAVCRMVGYWLSIAYARELIEQISISHTVDSENDDERILGLLKIFSPSEIRYFLWLALREVAIGVLAGSVSREVAFDRLIEGALKISKKYMSGYNELPHWSWFNRNSSSYIEEFMNSLDFSDKNFDRIPYEQISLK